MSLSRYLGSMRNGIWYDSDSGLYHVVVDGHQVGLWTKRRWARRDFRYHLREARRSRRVAQGR